MVKSFICDSCNFAFNTEKEFEAHMDKAHASPPATAKQQPLLHRAEELINGQRQADYGDKLQNFSQIAMFFQAVLAPKLNPNAVITAEDVALCMIGVKMARLSKSPDHTDSVLDIAGYAGCYDMLQQERASNKPMLGATWDARKKRRIEYEQSHSLIA